MEKNKKNKITNVPNLRFDSCDLNRCKIEKITLFHKQGYYTNEKYSSESEFYIFSGSNFKNHQLCYDSCNKINMNEKDSKSFAINKGDVLLVRSGNVGDYAIVESEVQKAIFGSYLIKFVLNQNLVSNRYFGYFYESPAFKQQLVRIVQASANTNINAENIKSIFISYPSIGFQNKITSFLELIDRRIETQNKIIEKYESLIKQLNDDIFSRGDNSKISDFIQELSKRNKDGAVTNVLSVSNKNGFVKQSEQFEDKELASEDKTNYKIVQNGDFAFNPARINVGSIALLKNQEIGIVSPMYICFKAKNIPSEILESYFSSSSFKKEMNKRLEGSVRMCLTIDGMKNIRFHNPSKKEIDILSHLTKLKELVAISKRILDLYNSQKSYLLSNLFI